MSATNHSLIRHTTNFIIYQSLTCSFYDKVGFKT